MDIDYFVETVTTKEAELWCIFAQTSHVVVSQTMILYQLSYWHWKCSLDTTQKKMDVYERIQTSKYLKWTIIHLRYVEHAGQGRPTR